ncbi:MAG: hypothetical protein OQJ76_08015, partial [Rhodospirillales bacterium]|nr:hypothetical protein [Rhodospirillales bacterium]
FLQLSTVRAKTVSLYYIERAPDFSSLPARALGHARGRVIVNETPFDLTLKEKKNPVMGWFAVGFGFAGIFLQGIIFVPLSLICSVIALFLGQISWGVIGLMLSVVGLLSSPLLLSLIGLGVLAAWFQNLMPY